MGLERRGCVVQPWPLANQKREEPVDEAKPFKIPKREVWEAFKRVKANQGAAGVDGQSITADSGHRPAQWQRAYEYTPWSAFTPAERPGSPAARKPVRSR